MGVEAPDVPHVSRTRTPILASGIRPEGYAGVTTPPRPLEQAQIGGSFSIIIPVPRPTRRYGKPPLTEEQLANRLQERGLMAPDADRAIRYLRHIGYYRPSPTHCPSRSQGTSIGSDLERPSMTYYGSTSSTVSSDYSSSTRSSASRWQSEQPSRIGWPPMHRAVPTGTWSGRTSSRNAPTRNCGEHWNGRRRRPSTAVAPAEKRQTPGTTLMH